MATLKITEYNPGHSVYGPRLTDEEWESFKPLLVDLDSQGIGRKEIVKIAMERHGFRGTYAAMNKRFKKWGLTNTRDSDAMGLSVKLPTLPDAPFHQTSENSHDRDSALEEDDWIENSVIPIEAYTKTVLEPSHSQPKSVLDELILSTSNLSVEDAGAVGAMLFYKDDSSQNFKAKSAIEIEVFSEDMGVTFDHPVSGDVIDDEGNQFRDVEETRPNPPENHTTPLPCPPKRSRSQISPFVSCEFGFGASSQTQSFMHLAKRLRYHKPAESPISWKSKFSWESSYRSGNFAAVTGLGSALDFAIEELEEPTNFQKKTSVNNTREMENLSSPLNFAVKELKKLNGVQKETQRTFKYKSKDSEAGLYGVSHGLSSSRTISSKIFTNLIDPYRMPNSQHSLMD